MKTNNNFHILIVDDEKLNIDLAAAYLKTEGYRLSYAMNAIAALESISKNDISLILLDINMPKREVKICINMDLYLSFFDSNITLFLFYYLLN